MQKEKKEIKFSQDQYDLLLQSLENWNKWREDHPAEEVLLEGVNLRDADLKGANLKGANLKRAELLGANLEKSNISYANLEGARLVDAKLKNADLRGSNLKETDLTLSKLKSVNLSGANLSHANLPRADLSGANLSHANLEGADLNGVNLEGAELNNTNLTLSDLRNCSGITLNNTMVRNARFSPNAPDLWSVLRRTYTGHRLILNLLFFMAFIMPYAAKTLFWIGVNNTQEATSALLVKTQTITIPEKANNIAICLSSECEPYIVWELLIGLDKSPFYWGLACLLFFYNICKIGLTWLVSPLREEEERSGHSPQLNLLPKGLNNIGWFKAWKLYLQTYGWMAWPHQFVKYLFWIAIFAFLVHIYNWLMLPVYIPAT